MTQITEITEKMLRESAYQSICIKVMLASGTPIEDITSSDIVSGTFVIQRDSVCGDSIEIGNMSAADLKFTLDNKKDSNGIGKFDSVKFNGARLTCTSIVISEDGTESRIPLGVFTVDNQPRALETIEITAMDETVKLAREFKYTGLFPTSLYELVSMGLTACGVQYVTDDLYIFPNETVVENFIADVKQTITWRQVIMWACQLICTCAYADGEGKLRFRFYETNESEYWETEQGEAVCTESGETIFLDFGDPIKKDFVLFESDRFADGSIFDEDDTVITGHQFTVGDVVYPTSVEPGYVLQTEDNLIFTYLSDENKEIFAEIVNQKLNGFSYRQYSAETHAYPHLFPLDRIVYCRNEEFISSIVTNHTYTLNGSSKLSAKAKSREDAGRIRPSIWTAKQNAVIGQINKNVSENRYNLTAQESATLHLNQTAASAMGMYYKEVTDENGGVVRYWHDNESLENSLYICMQNSGGSFSTNTGWNHGNPQWTAGTDKFGNAVVSLLNTIGIQAEWIQADSITTDKLSIGQSERGTNLIEDSSFEHGGVFYRATYSDDTEDAVIVSPAHNDRWNAVSFDSSETYGIRYRGYLEVPIVGGFDGNKAILDVNHKGLSEDAEEWFTGYEQIQPIPIEMLTHTVSFYYRIHRYPIGTPQGTETAHAKYAFKIQWLDGNGAEISCTFQSFSVQSDGTETWNRLYAAVNPPNGTVSAKFAIGFVCTDLAILIDGDETGYPNLTIWNDVETDAVGGYPDLAFLDLDGILFETGTSLNTWTCSESELQNTGVIINSNGINIADGKISVTDIYGRKVLYTDGNNNLQLVGGLTAQMHDKTDNRVCAQMQIASSNERNPYADSSGTFYNSFLGQTFTRFDKDGTAEKVGHIGMTFTQDENVSNDRPMEFYSENGFWFNGKGFWFNRTRPLICDPVEIDEDIGYLAYVISPGWYTVSTDAKAAKIRQTPVPRAFFMQVFRFGNYVTQYFVSRIGETYQRTFDYASPDGVSGYNWTHVTGTYTQSLKESLHRASISDIPPGKYTVEAEDIILVQHLNDERNYEDIFPVKKKGVLESFNGTDGNTYQRYTTWDGFVYTRHSYPGSWTWWWCNGVRADN